MAVAPGDTPAFLAPLGVEELDREPDIDRSELVDLLRRLGLRSLGAFAALAPGDVASRFGADAVLATGSPAAWTPGRRCAAARPRSWPSSWSSTRPSTASTPPRSPPAALAERLHAVLAGARAGVHPARGRGAHGGGGGAAPDLAVRRAAHPGRHRRPGPLAARRLAGPRRTREPVVRLRLVPEETVAAGALQLGLWGEVGEADERAGRALVRVQALLGPEAVVTAVLGGGRDPAERVRLVPWGDDRGPAGAGRPRGRGAVGTAAALARTAARTVPGRRAPGPAARAPVRCRGAAGAPRRPGPAHRTPAHARRRRRAAVEVRGWAGPWPVVQRWWAPDGVAGSRLQVLRADGAAFLLFARAGRWEVAGVYD